VNKDKSVYFSSEGFGKEQYCQNLIGMLWLICVQSFQCSSWNDIIEEE
jgi:hypothetical protein